MEPNFIIKSIEVQGLHGHQLIKAEFRPGLNIIHGRNGSGKTTLLHILANLCETDVERFCRIRFYQIRIETGHGSIVELRQVQTESSTVVEIRLNGEAAGSVATGAPTPSALKILLRAQLGGTITDAGAANSAG